MQSREKILLLTIVGVLFSGGTSAAEIYSGPKALLTAKQNKALYKKYCGVVSDSNQLPVVQYKNPLVNRAAEILSKKVAVLSYYFYQGPVAAYGLGTSNNKLNPVPQGTPAYVTPQAHTFLTLLCGEFRDRVSLIEAKLNWVTKIYKLPVEPQKKIDLDKPVWSQVSAHSYDDYLNFSRNLWHAKQAARLASNSPNVKLGDYKVDAPVEGTTVCEVKYIFSEYITAAKAFPIQSAKSYFEGYQKFSEEKCKAEDRDYYYDFRGDSNFKPNSPESNGMLWYANHLSKNCKGLEKSSGKAGISDADCAGYFRKPFQSRWSAARAGLATWLFRDRKHDEAFASEGSSVYITSHREALSKPFGFKFEREDNALFEFLDASNALSPFARTDIGFNEITRLGTDSPDLGYAYERLRDAVNRHTDWYASGYADLSGTITNDQAYSPFVASSYEMSESNGFTQPGLTVNSPSDGRKHWMFVFRIHKSKLVNTETLAEGARINLDQAWFDETSLGTNGLAKKEKAWDRMGTALEDELDSIIYLHNIETSMSVSADDLEP